MFGETSEKMKTNHKVTDFNETMQNILIEDHCQEPELCQKVKSIILVIMFIVFVSVLGFVIFNDSSLNNNAHYTGQSGEIENYNYYIISSEPFSNESAFLYFIGSLDKQTYKNWKLIIHINNSIEYEELRNYSTSNASQQFSEDSSNISLLQNFNETLKKLPKKLAEKIIVLQSVDPGTNLYNSLNNVCQQNSVAIFMEENQQFYSKQSLANIVSYFEGPNSKGNYILAPGIKLNSTRSFPNKAIKNFQRFQHTLKNSNINQKIKEQLFSHIEMHVRAFKVSFFKDIMPFDLMAIEEKFFQSKNAFFFPLLEMAIQCPNCYKSYKQVREQCKSDVPYSIVLVNQILFKSSRPLKQFDEEAQMIYSKITYNRLDRKCSSSTIKKQNGRPKHWGMDMLPGQYNLLNRSFSSEPKIPRIVHQCWISQSDPSPLKLSIMRTARELYQSQGWQYKLWTKQNLTKQNFPRTFNIIQQLIELDKTFPFLRLSMVTDLMRLQLLYLHGGVYLDINYQPFQTLQNFRHFPLILGNQDMFIVPNAYSVGYCGSEKNNQIINRLLQQSALKTINLQGRANFQTGPFYIGKFTTLQDLYFGIKILPTENYLPYMPWGVRDQRFSQCKCRTTKYQAQKVKERTQITKFQQFYTVFPCKSFYNERTLGVDHFYTGASWQKKRTQ